MASLVSPEQHARLKSLGVGDSKTLDDPKIRALAPILKQEIPHQALLLTPKKIQSGHRLWLQCGICQGCSSQSSHFFALATRGKSSKDCSRCLYDQEKNDRYVQAEANQVPTSRHPRREGRRKILVSSCEFHYCP